MAAATAAADGSGRAPLVLTFRIVSRRRRKLFQSVDVGSWDRPSRYPEGIPLFLSISLSLSRRGGMVDRSPKDRRF